MFVLEQTIYLHGPQGWDRIPRGYVTDFGSIPTIAMSLTMANVRPLGKHAWAALGHDWRYAVGQAGRRLMADKLFQHQMEQDKVEAPKRFIMFQAVRKFGGGGYEKAKTWWSTENFVDPDTGEPVAPLFPREDAFAGARWGLREKPDWQEV